MAGGDGSDAALVAAVASGGVVGTALRYAVARFAPVAAGTFPASTLLVNATGSAALGLLMAALARPGRATERWRAFAGTGIVGAFTTFSTFAVEVDRLFAVSRAGLAVTYVGLSVVVGLGAAAVGLMAGRRVWRLVDPPT
ncbi:MAG: CrcB family protein [Actinobacteria bacterium]|nr:CrcB family protein [Actinomycetota bacterium]